MLKQVWKEVQRRGAKVEQGPLLIDIKELPKREFTAIMTRRKTPSDVNEEFVRSLAHVSSPNIIQMRLGVYIGGRPHELCGFLVRDHDEAKAWLNCNQTVDLTGLKTAPLKNDWSQRVYWLYPLLNEMLVEHKAALAKRLGRPLRPTDWLFPNPGDPTGMRANTVDVLTEAVQAHQIAWGLKPIDSDWMRHINKTELWRMNFDEANRCAWQGRLHAKTTDPLYGTIPGEAFERMGAALWSWMEPLLNNPLPRPDAPWSDPDESSLSPRALRGLGKMVINCDMCGEPKRHPHPACNARRASHRKRGDLDAYLAKPLDERKMLVERHGHRRSEHLVPEPAPERRGPKFCLFCASPIVQSRLGPLRSYCVVPKTCKSRFNELPAESQEACRRRVVALSEKADEVAA